MKVVILAGGLGTRLSEETHLKPKPMVEIGGRPILWHIMKSFSSQGFNEFVICLGYKGYKIKSYFSNYFLHASDLTFDFETQQTHMHSASKEAWKVTLADTGELTQTGGRLLRVMPYLDPHEDFLMTYGDGLSDVPIADLVTFHQRTGRLATVTSVTPPARFGALTCDGDKVVGFREKSQSDVGRINGGFFVLSPKVLDLVDGDHMPFEEEPLLRLTKNGQLSAYRHDGFWHAMDTLRDKRHLELLWSEGNAPWKTWS